MSFELRFVSLDIIFMKYQRIFRHTLLKVMDFSVKNILREIKFGGFHSDFHLHT